MAEPLSESANIERNLKTRNGRPPRPTRTGVNNTGRGESSFTAMATTRSTGSETSKPRIAAQRSNRRLVIVSAARLAQWCPHDIDHVIDVVVRHSRVDRQRAGTLEHRFRRRELPWLIAVRSLVDRMQIQGNEVHRGADTLLSQPLDDVVPTDRERLEVHFEDVEVPGACRTPHHAG